MATPILEDPSAPVRVDLADALGDVEHVIFSSEGIKIHGALWRKADQAPKGAVLFCHGAFETRKNWAAFAQKLNRDGFTTFTFDFAGHGESQGMRGMVNLRTWAYNIRDAISYLQARGCPAFGLVGWESGGSAAVLAAAHDERLSCAVILSAPIYLMPTLAERAAYGLASIVARLKKAIFHKALTLSRLNEMKELGILSDEAANEAYFADPEVQEIYRAVPIPESLDSVWVDITGAAKKIRIPVLVMQGSEDKVVPMSQSQKLFGLLQGRKELKAIEDCGHAIHLDVEKETVYTMISAWMKSNLPK